MPKASLWLFGLLGLGASAPSCGGEPARALATPLAATDARGGGGASSAALAPRAAAASAAHPTSEARAELPNEPTLLITERALLEALEARGLSLAALLGAAPGSARDNQALGALPAYASLTATLAAELERSRREDKLAGVELARFAHRLFDARFLRSPRARFELAGVVNRQDRAPFSAGSCGETRLVYRLSYEHDTERASRLPMTLGVELRVPEPAGGCREAARRWLEPTASSAGARAEWLRGERGPLAAPLVTLARESARVVINLQLVRWPATMRPDLGGHAEYLLRAFRLTESGKLAPERLENTPDPAQLRANATLERRLLGWLTDEASLAAVDAGAPLLPAELLAERAISVTPRGLARLANRPFTSALDVHELPALDLSQRAFVKSPAGLLRRLDQLSCPGCHEARSVAGFHLLGEDPAGAPLENSLVSAVSAHVLEDMPRRRRIARQLLAGEAVDFSAPFAEHPGDAAGGYGAHCALSADPTFAGWSCATGLRCSAIEAAPGDPVGQCLPETPEVGDACETASVRPHADRRRDGMSRVRVEACQAALCNRSGVGFPGGMCTASCGAPGAVCGPIAVLDSFNACLGRGESFLACIRGNVRPSGLRGCSVSSPCRDDYVCARAVAGGVCLPPYFVFQLRVDGHSPQ